ncbi:thiamine phosphate synthase [Mucilaginibacter sp. X5P1]|uniref:thiamine phosphate synthase n=1 Tax=Mucilaginibacter sp. X5P1 TaxID=2723088 RepID=UPI0016181EB0|nr:thiamine phosphate synthase [Mucilaginibacter sp. X5P1]MBB6137974.1 thiamine-phosphate pyrophosphorylase [Mucilaginibacter sp. X5P1]
MIDKLHYISQQAEDGSHLTAIQQALEAGCKWIQLRVKNQSNKVVLEYAITANKLCKLYGAKLIVDDHPEIALAAGAYGVHLGLQDMPIAQARRIIGDKMIIGGTANTFQHIQQRVDEGVNYIGCGPYRFTTTKEKLSPIVGLRGYEKLAEQMLAANIKIPVIAIGGILYEDVAAIMQTGLYGVAISGAITFSDNREQTVKQIYQQLNSSALMQVI